MGCDLAKIVGSFSRKDCISCDSRGFQAFTSRTFNLKKNVQASMSERERMNILNPFLHSELRRTVSQRDKEVRTPIRSTELKQ